MGRGGKRGKGRGLAVCAHAQVEPALQSGFLAPAAPTWRTRQLVLSTQVRPFPLGGGPAKRLRFGILRKS